MSNSFLKERTRDAPIYSLTGAHLRDGLIVAKVGIRAKARTAFLAFPPQFGRPIRCSLTAKGGM
jgi:hypothetical protein